MNKCPNDYVFHQKLKNYEKWLLKLGEGKLPSDFKFNNNNVVEIPSDMWQDTKEDVIDAVFEDFHDNIGNGDYCSYIE